MFEEMKGVMNQEFMQTTCLIGAFSLLLLLDSPFNGSTCKG
jgi:hypothetical protein